MSVEFWFMNIAVCWKSLRKPLFILKKIICACICIDVYTDSEAETPILWPPHVKSWLIWKDPDAGRDWGQEEKGMKEDEMAGWHHRLDWHGFGWTPGAGDGPGGLACCDSWGRKELDMTSDWTELKHIYAYMYMSISTYLFLHKYIYFPMFSKIYVIF